MTKDSASTSCGGVRVHARVLRLLFVRPQSCALRFFGSTVLLLVYTAQESRSRTHRNSKRARTRKLERSGVCLRVQVCLRPLRRLPVAIDSSVHSDLSWQHFLLFGVEESACNNSDAGASPQKRREHS